MTGPLGFSETDTPGSWRAHPKGQGDGGVGQAFWVEAMGPMAKFSPMAAL